MQENAILPIQYVQLIPINNTFEVLFMFTDLYNIVYLVTVGAWVTCYQHITGTYRRGAGIGAGLGDTFAILLSYMCISIEILIGVVIYLAV